MKPAIQLADMSIIKRMELEATKLTGVVSLAQGIPWYPSPDPVMNFLTEKIKSGQTSRYSIVQGIPELREQVALRYYQKYDVEIDPGTELVITAGAIQAITNILLTILHKGDEVILIDPSYSSYSNCIKVARGNPIYIPLDENLDLDVSAVKNAIKYETKAIIIANPNNPTGSIFSLAKIEELLKYLQYKNVVLILDEVYEEFIYDGQTFNSAINLFEQYKDNLIIVNSWSKTFGMTGWRVGYALGHEDIITEVIKVHDSVITCAPVHSQRAALSTFEIYDEWADKIRGQLQERRDYTLSQLNKLDEFIEYKHPSAAYFVFPRFRYTDNDVDECFKILHEKKLALVPGSGFGQRGVGCFRICFGRDFYDLKEGFKRLKDYFKG